MANGNSTSGLPQFLLKCARNTTHHGITHAVNANRVVVRIFWALIIFGAYALFSVHCFVLVTRYMEYPVSTIFNYDETPFEFPDVSVCNLQPFSLRELELQESLMNFSVNDNSLDYMYENLRFSRHDIVISCSYNGKPCRSRDFQIIDDTRYKHCYTFQPEARVIKRREVEMGLNVILFAEGKHNHTVERRSLTETSEWEEVGYHVVVHEPLTHPHPAIRGFDISPGHWIKGAVTIRNMSLIPAVSQQPKTCKESRSNITYCTTLGTYKNVYLETDEDCYAQNIQNEIFIKCGCISEKHVIPLRFCNLTIDLNMHCMQIGKDDCVDQVVERINAGYIDEIAKKCPPLCLQRKWTVQHSESQWPTLHVTRRIYDMVKKTYTKTAARNGRSVLDEIVHSNVSDEEMYEMLKCNLVKLTIYPEELIGQHIIEERAFPLASLLGEIGGVLGLYLGCSLLTFFEPISLLVNLIFTYLGLKCRKGEQSASRGDKLAHLRETQRSLGNNAIVIQVEQSEKRANLLYRQGLADD